MRKFFAESANGNSFWTSLVNGVDGWRFAGQKKLSFIYWSKNQPDNCCPPGRANYTVHIPGQGWDDRGENELASYVCKYKCTNCYYTLREQLSV